MDQMERLQAVATTLLEKAQNGTVSELAAAVEKATGVLRLSCDLEKSPAETRKLALEEQKLQHEINDASKHERSERLREYVSLLTPIVAIVTLAATLFSQTWQFLRSERERRDAAEAAQWEEAVKAISQTTKLSPGVVALNRFLKSSNYGDQAKSLAVQLLANGSDKLFFDELFGEAFVPISERNNFDRVIELDRALNATMQPLWSKTYDATTKHSNIKKLQDPHEIDVYKYVDYVIPKISAQVGSALKSPRRPSPNLDLSATNFMSSDWGGADLSGANIASISLAWMGLKGANLDKITYFKGATFHHVAWWEAEKISPKLREYLETDSKALYDPQSTYGPMQKDTFTPQQYAAALDRLKHQAP